MDFGEQIKMIRKERGMTQGQFAKKLGISRQAVLEWENDRNLPDIEMLITIALVYHISLDDLILGGISMNNMTEKLIQDGSETNKAKYNLKSICAGALLLGVGLILLTIKAFSANYLDASGYLHEDNFILIPLACLFLLFGVISFVFVGIENAFAALKYEDKHTRNIHIIIAFVSFAVVTVFAILFFLLVMGNL